MKAPGAAVPLVSGKGPAVERFLLLSPTAVLLGAFFFLPLLGLVLLSVSAPDVTFRHYAEFLSEPSNLVVLQRTFWLAAVVTVICLLLGYPLAYWISSARPGVAALLMLAVVIPFFTSYLVRTYSWMVLLGRFGVINQALMAMGITDQPLPLIYSFLGVSVGMVYILMPYAVLILVSVMKGIPGALPRAAATLGASPTQSFWRVFFPLSAPGVAAVTVLIFVFALGFYITPALLGGPRQVTVPMLVDVHVHSTLNWPMAAAIAVVTLVVTLGLYSVSNRLVNVEALLGGRYEPNVTGKQTRHSGSDWYVRVIDFLSDIGSRFGSGKHGEERIERVGRFSPGKVALRLVSLAVVVFLLSPVFIIVPISFSSSPFLKFPPPGFSLRWYEAYFTSRAWLEATAQSFQVATAATAISLVVGATAAYALVRASRRVRGIGFQILLMPLIVPTIVSAVSLYFVFSYLKMIDSSLALVLAHSVGAVPLVALIIAANLQGLDRRLEHAAASLGASRFTTIRRVIVPLIIPPLVVAGLLAFLHSFDEVVLALFLTGANTTTLPVKMWSGVREEITPTIAAVSTLLIVFAVTLFVATEFSRHSQKRTRAD